MPDTSNILVWHFLQYCVTVYPNKYAPNSCFIVFLLWFWIGNSQFYPYFSWLLHWHLSSHMIQGPICACTHPIGDDVTGDVISNWLSTCTKWSLMIAPEPVKQSWKIPVNGFGNEITYWKKWPSRLRVNHTIHALLCFVVVWWQYLLPIYFLASIQQSQLSQAIAECQT